MTYRTAYPARSAGRSNAGHRRRSLVDSICAVLLVAGTVGSMVALVSYANARDAEHFRSQSVASVPTRPEECNGDCPPMDEHEEVFYGM
jgi:hypothetical protein